MIGSGDEPAPRAEDGPSQGFLTGVGKDGNLGARVLAPFLGEVKEGGEREEGGEKRSHSIAEGVSPWRGVVAGEDNMPGVARLMPA